MDFHLNLPLCVVTAHITMILPTAHKLCLPAGLAQVQASSLPVVPAVEMNLCNPDGEYWNITQVTVLSFSQPHLGQVVRVDILVQLRVTNQLPLHLPHIGPVPLPPEVLVQLDLATAVRLAQLTVVAPMRGRNSNSTASKYSSF